MTRYMRITSLNHPRVTAVTAPRRPRRGPLDVATARRRRALQRLSARALTAGGGRRWVIEVVAEAPCFHVGAAARRTAAAARLAAAWPCGVRSGRQGGGGAGEERRGRRRRLAVASRRGARSRARRPTRAQRSRTAGGERSSVSATRKRTTTATTTRRKSPCASPAGSAARELAGRVPSFTQRL